MDDGSFIAGDIDRRARLLVAAYRAARQRPKTTIIGEAS
jgi:hypothetical protein